MARGAEIAAGQALSSPAVVQRRAAGLMGDAWPMRRELIWIGPAGLLVGLEYGVAYFIGTQVGFSYRLALEEYLVAAAVLSTGVAGAFFAVALSRCFWRQVESPIAQMRTDLPRALPVMTGISLVALQIGALNWTKSMIPLVTPFWADVWLASADRLLFQADPWTYLHALPAPFIDVLYSAWAPIKFVTLSALLLMRSSPRKSRALLAYFVTMFFGLVGQYLLASGGPIFYQRLGFGDRFDGLPVPHFTRLASDYLWAAYSRAGGEVGAGISAFPSMHVAIATWIALSAMSMNRRLGTLAVLYWAVICFGSVYLGWHYVMDGLSGIIISLVAWAAAGQLMPLRPGQFGSPALREQTIFDSRT